MRHRSPALPRRSIAVVAVLGAVAASVAVATSTPVAAASVPAGFSDLVLGTFSRPTAVEMLPDGRLVVLEQGGRVKIGPPDGPYATALSLPDVCSNSERGFLGFTHDPGFLGNGLVYLYSTRTEPGAPGGCVNRVSSFRMTGATIDPATETVLVDRISSVNGNHNGGDLDFGSDGWLYVSVGDGGRDPRGDSGSGGANDAAQDLSLLNGKILRITRDGQPAPGNPIGGPGSAVCARRGNTPSTPTSPCRELFAWGLRNPFRFAFDRDDGSSRFFINDVGQSAREEVDAGGIGRNYGWPAREGRCPQGQHPPCAGPGAGLTDPITDYARAGGRRFITAGAFIPDGLWPAAYDGSYFFADGASGEIWTRRADGTVDYGSPFATGFGGLVDMTFGFDAAGRLALYYVQSGGSLGRIVPTAPPATATAEDLQLLPVDPVRVYDTDAGIGVAAGDVLNGTTRVIDLDPPAPYPAALVNLTFADTAGPGFLRTWNRGGRRPDTAALNVDRLGAAVGNVAIVPLSADGEFLLEAVTTGRVVIDLLGWMADTPGAVDDGRLVPLTPARLVDTRLAAGTVLASGSRNPWSRSGNRFDVEVAGQLGIPGDGRAAAAVVSIAAIAGTSTGGFLGAHAFGSPWPGTSSVNVVVGDVRANLAIVPLGAGKISMRTAGIDHAVVDVLGYVTSGVAPASTSGLYSALTPTRLVDSRRALGFDRLRSGETSPVDVDGALPAAAGAGAVVQHVVVTGTGGAGYVVGYPGTGPAPGVATVNFTAAGQTRGTLAITALPVSGVESFGALTSTDVVVDVVGVFSR